MKTKKGLITAAVFAALSASAQADEYGCQVLLCLSNPNGPMAVQQCEPPIQRFLREQAERPAKPFPRCEEANGKAVATAGLNPYDACPEGTAAVASGTRVMQGLPPQTKRNIYGQTVAVDPDSSDVLTGIGEGAGMTFPTGKKVCVGKSLGFVTLVHTNNSDDIETVEAFDSVVTMDPAKGSPQYFDVFIEGKQFRRVRF